MKRLGYFLLTLICPWLIFVMNGLLGAAFIAFMLQASLIGWPFASVWAWRVNKENTETADTEPQSPSKE